MKIIIQLNIQLWNKNMREYFMAGQKYNWLSLINHSLTRTRSNKFMFVHAFHVFHVNAKEVIIIIFLRNKYHWQWFPKANWLYLFSNSKQKINDGKFNEKLLKLLGFQQQKEQKIVWVILRKIYLCRFTIFVCLIRDSDRKMWIRKLFETKT